MVSDTAATATASTSHGHRLGGRMVPSSPSHGASLKVLIGLAQPPGRAPAPPRVSQASTVPS